MTELEKLKSEIEKLNQRIEEIESKEIETNEKNEITFIDGDKYYFIDSYMDINRNSYNSDSCIDEKLINVSNAFKTKEQAEYIADKFKFLLKLYKYHLRYDNNFTSNWSNDNQRKYYIYYNDKYKKYVYNCDYNALIDTIYFSSCEIAEKVCNELNSEIESEIESEVIRLKRKNDLIKKIKEQMEKNKTENYLMKKYR